MKKQVLILISFLFCMASFAMAGVTGKIAGRITDANTGEPLPGANVVIEGTIQGAACDAEGDYYIINVPPGTYVVTASMMGYETVRTTGVLVSVDRTITVNYPLATTVIELAEVTAEAERRAVRLDVSSSQVTATAEQITEVPVVLDINEFIALQAGVEDGVIRGGELDQTQLVVDGLPVVNNVDNEPMNIVNLSAVEELTIIKGGFQAEYGNLRSGMINVVTKEGRRNYHGSIDFRYTTAAQKHRGSSIFDYRNFFLRPYLDPDVCWDGTKNGNWNAYTQGQYPEFGGWDEWVLANPETGMTAEEARNLFIWQHRAQGDKDLVIPSSEELGHPHSGEYGNKPDVNVDLSLSGPVPVIGQYLGDMTFLISHRDFTEQYVYPAYGDDVWMRNTYLKLTSRLSSAIKVGIVAAVGKEESAGMGASNLGEVGDRGTYFIHGASPLTVDHAVIGLTFDHVLSPSTFYNVRISNVAITNDMYGARTLRDTAILATFGNVDIDERPWGWYWVSGYQYALADKMVIGGVGAGQRNNNKINTTSVKFDITSQVNKRNQVKTGFEIVHDNYDVFYGEDGLDPTGNYVVDWEQTPLRGGGYIQNKLEYEGLIANIGVRVDYNLPNTDWYTTERYSPWYSRVYLGSDIWKRKDRFLANAPGEPAKGGWKVSPRVGISHPISDVSKLFFSYGHYYSMPTSEQMFEVNYGLGSSGIDALGNPNLTMPRTIAYELGYEHELANMFLVSLAGYYKDVTDQIGQTSYINYDESVNYEIAENTHYADIRGLEVELRKDWGRWITGWVNYTYMVYTEGLIGRETNYQDKRMQVVEGLRNPVQEKPLPQPYANANIMVRTPFKWGPRLGSFYPLEQLSVSLLFDYAAGDYITWEPIPPYTLQNNLQWKDRYNLDARIRKTLSVGRVDFNFFVDIVNVLDIQYLIGVIDDDDDLAAGFENDDDYDDYLNSLRLPMYLEDKYQGDPTYLDPDGKPWPKYEDKVGDVWTEDKPYINMPNMDFMAWNSPRSIIVGFTLSF